MAATSTHSTLCSDELLAARVQEGCAASFAQLDERLRPRLLHVLSRRLPTREDAEDVVQQTLLRVFEKIHLYDVRQRLSPWVFTIAIRLAAQYVRRKKIPITSEADPSREFVDRDHTPDVMASRREERDELWRVADRVLKPEQWTALWLFYGEEQSVKEIAQSLGRTKTSTSVLLFRARRTLLPHLRKLAHTKDAPASLPTDSHYGAILLVAPCAGGHES